MKIVSPKEADLAKQHAFLAKVRRMEAVSFRSFPSTTTYFDGTWAIRLTAGHPAKRLNSVNPLDPFDTSEIARRLALAEQRFLSFGRPLIFRQSPLAPPSLDAMLDDRGWERFEESIVMAANISTAGVDTALDQVSIKDIGYWVDSYLALSGEDPDNKPGLVEVISSIEGQNGLFLREHNASEVAAVRCVRDGQLAGLFDLVTGEDFKREGHARELVASALKWASKGGAITAWLQVVADNEAAIGLYREFGFEELYRYAYRRPSPVQSTRLSQ